MGRPMTGALSLSGIGMTKLETAARFVHDRAVGAGLGLCVFTLCRGAPRTTETEGYDISLEPRLASAAGRRRPPRTVNPAYVSPVAPNGSQIDFILRNVLFDGSNTCPQDGICRT